MMAMRVPRLIVLALVLSLGVGIPTAAQMPNQADNAASAPFSRANAARTGEMPSEAIASEPRLRWQFVLGEPQETYVNFASPVVVDGVVYASGLRGGFYYAIDAATGAVAWRYAAEGQVTGDPIVAGGMLFVGEKDGRFIALNDDGLLAWTYQTGGPLDGSATIVDGVAYVISGDGILSALGN
jgi:outer membrane protein assembly factor BamB